MQVKNLALSGTTLSHIKNFSFAKDLVLVLVFAVLTGLSSQLKIDIGAVPITMQTFVVLLSGVFLGSKKGAASQIAYLFMGLSGIPWFARGGSMAYLFSPTFGYILGFVLAAFITGLLVEKGWGKNIKTMILALLAGEAAIYLSGLLWLYPFVGLEKLLIVGLYPFVPGEFLKLLLIIPFLSLGKEKI
ncbi:MAG: biotin transporter BioY [Parcubacteria group bacterium]|nr:MAG: biotin transporter BioY [Parcubacteria group bacterium]